LYCLFVILAAFINLKSNPTMQNAKPLSQIIGEMIVEIIIGDSAVEMVEDFCYLMGSFVTSNNSCDKGFQIMIGKANIMHL